ncbi:pirin family protein [Marinomonas algicola]|uniref:pirin family protein n=1 Tax=Marinomonas algicola TaxID=2773454 RepID=UPI00174E708A|nr:pirin family protein [Marinomonas algicola]
MKQADIVKQRKGVRTQDGDGVSLTRVFGGNSARDLDPFLMLDEFGSSDPEDYKGGFPPHPHRGFQTVTYMLKGKMEHTDHLGNVGLLEDGGLQWMNAGQGIIHSEMPKQTEGTMWGFQLWVNLPSHKKMSSAWYKDIPSDQIPILEENGITFKVLAGEHKGVKGALYDTESPTYLDIELCKNSAYQMELQPEQTHLLYVFVGEMTVNTTKVSTGELVQVANGDFVHLNSKNGARFLVISGTPLQEPVVQYGPFVMNTEAEIHQAISDYNNGTLAQVADAK